MQEACATSGVIAQAWQPLPTQAEPDDPVLPAEPPELVVLCCERFLALGISAASPRMTWAPVQRFEPGVHGSRVHTGWIGNWVCNTCGQTFDQHDDRLALLRASHSCALQGNCRLCLDFRSGSYTWMCGVSGRLEDAAALTDAPVQSETNPSMSTATVPCNVPGDVGYFAFLPPATNDEATNSFLYCPLLLQAAGLLQEEVARAWGNAIPWFTAACDHLRGQTRALGFVAQAYAELLQIACQHDASMMQVFSQTGDAAAAQHLHRLAAGSSGVEVALATVLPGVVGVDGHVPNQLQDFLLQVFGGLQLASDLDSAVTTFRNEGTWQRSLPSLLPANCDASSTRVERHDERHHTSISCMPSDRHHAAAAAANRSCSEPPGLSGLRVDPGMANSCQPVLQAALHEHPCTRQTTARFGAFRHCVVCNVRMPRAVSYFRCAEGCRFAACADCFLHPARPEQAHAPATSRLVSESTRESACANAAIQPQLTRFTRFLCLPRDEFANRIREMVNTQQFAGIGRPDLRMEGSTTWGVWLRLFHTRVASGTNHSRGPRVFFTTFRR